jgi:hypothetical protein
MSLTEAMSYGVRCAECGEWETACRCGRLPTACPKPLPESESEKFARKLATSRRLTEHRKPLKKSSKPIPKQNADRAKRRRGQYAKKLAAYRRSECFKIVEARAGGRCEESPRMWGFPAGVIRCPNRRGEPDVVLHHHHLTYARFGGKELPEDIRVLCTGHHEAREAKARPQNRGRKLS